MVWIRTVMLMVVVWYACVVVYVFWSISICEIFVRDDDVVILMLMCSLIMMVVLCGVVILILKCSVIVMIICCVVRWKLTPPNVLVHMYLHARSLIHTYIHTQPKSSQHTPLSHVHLFTRHGHSQGYGWEQAQNYPFARLTFLDIGNIHVIRASFQNLREFLLFMMKA